MPLRPSAMKEHWDPSARSFMQLWRDFSHDVTDADIFARMLAATRDSSRITVEDLLGGLYISNLESLVRYWNDCEHFGQLVQKECGVRSQRWHYWLSYGDEMRRAPKAHHLSGRKFIVWLLGKQSSASWRVFERDPTVLEVYSAASDFAKAKLNSRKATQPVITSRHVLLAIVQRRGLAISAKLLASGLDIQTPERDVVE